MKIFILAMFWPLQKVFTKKTIKLLYFFYTELSQYQNKYKYPQTLFYILKKKKFLTSGKRQLKHRTYYISIFLLLSPVRVPVILLLMKAIYQNTCNFQSPTLSLTWLTWHDIDHWVCLWHFSRRARWKWTLGKQYKLIIIIILILCERLARRVAVRSIFLYGIWWYPWQLSDGTISRPIAWNDKGFIETHGTVSFYMEDDDNDDDGNHIMEP